MNKSIPTKVNKFSLYTEGNRLIGIGDEVPLPDFEGVAETISGAGILGEIEDPTVGYFGNQEMEISFRMVDEDAVNMLDQTKVAPLEIRGSTQKLDSAGNIEFSSIRVPLRGRVKSFKPGKMKAGQPMECSVTMTVLYILIELDEKPMIELDKLNEVFKIRGKDILAQIKEMC